MTFQPCRPATIKLLPYERAPFWMASFFSDSAAANTVTKSNSCFPLILIAMKLTLFLTDALILSAI